MSFQKLKDNFLSETVNYFETEAFLLCTETFWMVHSLHVR